MSTQKSKSSRTRKKRILVVEDHPLVRKGLCDAINADADLQVCGEAESWHDAQQQVLESPPDLMVLDLNLKDGNGWTLLDQLRAAEKLPPTLVLSVCAEEVYARRLLQSGARGYLMKDEPIPQILEAIRKVIRGHLAVSDAVASNIIGNAAQGDVAAVDARTEMEALSDRELQVFEMISQGLGNKEIAERLGIGQKTISTHKIRLMEKLGVQTTPALVARTQRQA
ncbi:MAG: response regulator [Verrucomicrobiia bacterium]